MKQLVMLCMCCWRQDKTEQWENRNISKYFFNILSLYIYEFIGFSISTSGSHLSMQGVVLSVKIAVTNNIKFQHQGT